MMTTESTPSNGRTLHDLEEAVLAMINQEEVVAFHRGLVQIPSVNPPGDCRENIAYVEKPLRDAGFDIEIVQDLDIMPNLLASVGPTNGKTLLVNAHVDVVPVGERDAWKHEPFGAEVEDGKIFGRGAGDDKASVTAQVMAALALQRSGIPLSGRLVVNEVSDEEVGGQHGAMLVAENLSFRPDYVIVGEQTMNHVCVGEKGGAGVDITVTGKTAHGALPWEGANAIEAMAEIIVALRRELWPKLAERTHWAFKPSSGSVNMISGGVKANVVADKATCYVDRRVVPGEDPEECRAEIEEIARRAIASVPGTSVQVDFGRGFKGKTASIASIDEPLVQAMLGANKRLELSTDPTGFSMGTDGRFFEQQGIPTIIYGPGDPSLAHKPDEWVGIDEIMEATRAYAITMVRLIGDYEK
jgi:acetylornithine deacetylase/succinyl-diaminopimelate desuccinylase family protein